MGYVEHICQLCGVSFAIARLRTKHEPRETHAWSYHTRSEESYWSDDEDGYTCRPFEETGCTGEPAFRSDDAAADPVIDHERKEHIAGPGCRFNRGYNGNLISVEEMEGCRAIKAIVRKTIRQVKDWCDEDDDEEWERTTRYFITGTGDGSPDEAPLDNMDRSRHGLDNVLISNIFVEDDDDDLQWGYPVHPYCWEMFKRISTRTCDRIDVHGLFQYRVLHGDYEDVFNKLPRHPAINECREQWWDHLPGTEWLAANPVDIPGLKGFLNKGGDWVDVNAGAFNVPDFESDEAMEKIGHTPDPFSSLPTELALMVLSYLPSPSIASLRLSSRTFRQIPIIVFRSLIQQDFPWLWEIEQMEIKKTHWFMLYQSIRFTLSGLKGIQNRKRIWGEIEEMVRRIEGERREGNIEGWDGWDTPLETAHPV